MMGVNTAGSRWIICEGEELGTTLGLPSLEAMGMLHGSSQEGTYVGLHSHRMWLLHRVLLLHAATQGVTALDVL